MREQYHRITDHEHLRRDPKTRAILNVNKKEAMEYEMRSKMMSTTRNVSEEINNIKAKLSEIDTIKSDMQEIKNLLRELVK